MFYFRNFEDALIKCGKDLDVNVCKMDPVYNYFIQRNYRPNDILKEVTNFFNKLKDVVELIVVIIPDYPAGIYGKYKYIG